MARQGYLEGREMATTFDLLRANDLIWNYVASNWLMGEDPPAFDILAWNADSTRMPAAMHSFYLRTCYLENQLARGEMELAGVRLHLDTVTQDLYLVGAVTDHITPWTSSYSTTQLVKGDTRFVLSSSGHIAGIVSPAQPQGQHWTNDDVPSDPEVWLAGATEHEGSWWEDWVGWAKAHGGQRRKPRPWAATAAPHRRRPGQLHPRVARPANLPGGMDGRPPRRSKPAARNPTADAGSPGGGYPPENWTPGCPQPSPTAPDASGGALEDGGDALAADAHGDQGGGRRCAARRGP